MAKLNKTRAIKRYETTDRDLWDNAVNLTNIAGHALETTAQVAVTYLDDAAELASERRATAGSRKLMRIAKHTAKLQQQADKYRDLIKAQGLSTQEENKAVKKFTDQQAKQIEAMEIDF